MVCEFQFRNNEKELISLDLPHEYVPNIGEKIVVKKKIYSILSKFLEIELGEYDGDNVSKIFYTVE